METIDILRIIWYILLGILFLGYSILDGFDLGIGSLFPFLSTTEEDKTTLLNSIGPFWDGNEVWLLTAAGALFASFPHAYATVFSGFYLAMMLILFAHVLMLKKTLKNMDVVIVLYILIQNLILENPLI